MISPGGISLLRLIQGLVVRMPIPHLGGDRGGEEGWAEKMEEERQGWNGKGGRERRGEFNMKQHRNVSNIRRSSSSLSLIPKIVETRSYMRHPHTSLRRVETARPLFDGKVFHPANISPRKWIELLAPRRTEHARKLTLIEEKGNGWGHPIERVVFDNVRRIEFCLGGIVLNLTRLKIR